MGNSNRLKVAVLIGLLLLTAATVRDRGSSRVRVKAQPLSEALSRINGWVLVGSSPMADEIVSTLKLDDYVMNTYQKDGRSLTLYVGYYRSFEKIGAAHDPMVCMPGQGWTVFDTGSADKASSAGSHGAISYSTMTVEKGGKKELLLYWFQASDRALSGTFEQKLAGMWSRLRTGREENAFVRISVPVNGDAVEESRALALRFVESFYPVFLSYLET